MNISNAIPPPHKTFLEIAVARLKIDHRILGIAAGGSYIAGNMDEYSDLDLVIVCDPEAYDEVFHEKKEIAGSLGNVLESFTGEHVGEPRLLVCLYNQPILHVDFKFISLDDFDERVEDPEIIWERDDSLQPKFSTSQSKFPKPDLHWIENRVWVWIHYIAGKIGRGELFEAIEGLSFLRNNVLGPMALENSDARPQGVRRLEENAPEYLDQFEKTIPQYNQKSCIRALYASMDLYVILKNCSSKAKNIAEKSDLIMCIKKYVSDIEKSI